MFGAICGDILGSRHEGGGRKYDDISDINLMLAGSCPTDDTAMTVAVADWLMNDIAGTENEEELNDIQTNINEEVTDLTSEENMEEEIIVENETSSEQINYDENVKNVTFELD